MDDFIITGIRKVKRPLYPLYWDWMKAFILFAIDHYYAKIFNTTADPNYRLIKHTKAVPQ
jgi:hypothetical protein